MTEETVTLGAELERLDSAVDDVAASLQDVEGDTASAQALRQYANDLDTQGAALAALVEKYGTDATVTVRGLSAGEYARVEDRTAAMRDQSDQPGGLPGSSRNVFAAAGLVDAPFLETGADFDGRVSAVADQSVGVAKWLESKVNDLTSVDEGNWTPLRERLADTSTD